MFFFACIFSSKKIDFGDRVLLNYSLSLERLTLGVGCHAQISQISFDSSLLMKPLIWRNYGQDCYCSTYDHDLLPNNASALDHQSKPRITYLFKERRP
jgi:hypothetical protein